jgi:DNA-directed RNA polymerase subunit omega
MATSNIVAFDEFANASDKQTAKRGMGSEIMKSDLLEQAAETVPDPTVLINMVSRRVKQLNMGRTPLVNRMPGQGLADLALREIIEGKIILDGTKKAEKVKARLQKAAGV